MGLHPSSLSKCSNLWELSWPNWHLQLAYTIVTTRHLWLWCTARPVLLFLNCNSSTHESFSEGREPLASCSFRRWLTWSLRSTTTADLTIATVNADLREIRELVDYNCKISNMAWSSVKMQVSAYIKDSEFSFYMPDHCSCIHIQMSDLIGWLSDTYMNHRYRHSSLASQALPAGVVSQPSPRESLGCVSRSMSGLDSSSDTSINTYLALACNAKTVLLSWLLCLRPKLLLTTQVRTTNLCSLFCGSPSLEPSLSAWSRVLLHC